MENRTRHYYVRFSTSFNKSKRIATLSVFSVFFDHESILYGPTSLEIVVGDLHFFIFSILIHLFDEVSIVSILA